MGTSARPRLVCQSLWHTHGAATRRLAVDSRQINHADFRPNRFGENAGGVSGFDLGLIANRRFHFPDRSSNLEYDSGRFEHSNVSRWRASSLQGRRAPTARKAGWRSTTPGYSNDAAVENSVGRSDSIIGSQRNKITKRTSLSLLNRDI